MVNEVPQVDRPVRVYDTGMVKVFKQRDMFGQSMYCVYYGGTFYAAASTLNKALAIFDDMERS